jgi:hypothetical protein
MPVTKSRNGMHDMLGLDQTNTARFLFGEEEGSAPTSDIKSYLQMNATEDKFPILVRRDEFPGVVSYLVALSGNPHSCKCSYPHPLRL